MQARISARRRRRVATLLSYSTSDELFTGLPHYLVTKTVDSRVIYPTYPRTLTLGVILSTETRNRRFHTGSYNHVVLR